MAKPFEQVRTTGYQGLGFLKIEGEFIVNMIHDSRDLAMVKSICTLARELDIRTIAEYVESQEVMDCAAAAGIGYAQGYHIGRPQAQSRDVDPE